MKTLIMALIICISFATLAFAKEDPTEKTGTVSYCDAPRTELEKEVMFKQLYIAVVESMINSRPGVELQGTSSFKSAPVPVEYKARNKFASDALATAQLLTVRYMAKRRCPWKPE